MIKMNLTPEEIQILLQCMFACQWPGKDIIRAGLLADKLQKEITKLEQEKPK